METILKPKADRVLIEPTDIEQVTASGIIIPSMAQEKPNTGMVVSVGQGKDGIPVALSVGDKVQYGERAGIAVKVAGKEYLLMKESEIYGILS